MVGRDTWHRVAFTCAVEGADVILRKFVDGEEVGLQNLGAIDGRWSIYSRFDATPWFYLFTDDSGETSSGFVSSFLFADVALSPERIAELGGADADGILDSPCLDPDGCDDRVQFVRGDANADGGNDISDAVFVLNYLFVGGGLVPECAKSADANDSGVLDLTDAIFELNFLFQGGQPIPPPFPGCGLDETEDPLSCEAYAPCR